MISEIQSIDEHKIVKSRDMRDLADKTYNRIARTFHRTMQTSGAVRTASVCMELVSASMLNIIENMNPPAANITTITPYTNAIYPGSSFHKAEKTTGLMCFTAKRINTRSVFTDNNGNINSALTMSRTITTANNQPVSSVVENSITHMFKGDIPFITRIKELDISRTTMSLSIQSPDQPIPINAIRYVPMPAIGISTIDSIFVNSGSSLIMNGGSVFPTTTGHILNRSCQGYLHFEPADMSEITFNLSSEVYLPSMDCIAIGISNLVGEYNTYALKSYIGWVIPYKGEYTSLKRITAFPAEYSSSMSNISFRLYDNITDFTNVSNAHIYTFGNTQLITGVSKLQYPDLYLLMELSSVNNTTPCIGKIELEFE